MIVFLERVPALLRALALLHNHAVVVVSSRLVVCTDRNRYCPPAQPNSVAVKLVTNKIYLANSGSNNVTVIDGATKHTATWPPTSPFAVA